MKNKDYLKKLIIEDYCDKDGYIDLSGLDFSGYEVDISRMKAEIIHQDCQMATEISQDCQKADYIYQDNHKANTVNQEQTAVKKVYGISEDDYEKVLNENGIVYYELKKKDYKTLVQVFDFRGAKDVKDKELIAQFCRRKFMKDYKLTSMIEEEFFKENKEKIYDYDILRKSGYGNRLAMMKNDGYEIICILDAVNELNEKFKVFEYAKIGD